MTRNRPLDQKDVEILGALDKLGGKTSTEDLSKATGIPARTVRYRLQKMRDASILSPSRTYTHERKMGMGEAIILIHTTPGSNEILEKMFRKIRSIYFWSSTYGRYNGYILYCLYSVATPSVPRRLAEAFQKEGLISNFYLFDVTDYEHKHGDFKHLDPKQGWCYDWKIWHKKIKKNLKSKTTKINTKCEANPSILEFDTADYEILRSLYDNAMIPQKDLAKKFSLSETQVTKKIRRMHDAGVIKGYSADFHAAGVMLHFILFIEIEEPVPRIINNFHAHPFLGSLMMESRTRWGIRMGLPAEDIYGFLQGLELMEPYLKFAAFQVLYRFTRSPPNTHPYDLFNKEAHKWETPISDYLDIISNVMTESKSE
ncbi:MAG: Lrp/AsnC family transcriptional regulator [Candidatus Thorarchaeota archaeon]